MIYRKILFTGLSLGPFCGGFRPTTRLDGPMARIASWSSSALSAVSSTTSSTSNVHIQQDGEAKDVVQFTASPMQVFIEDTDAYGIMYNGNYLRAYDRALHMNVTQSTTRQTSKNPVSGEHEGWSIVSVGQQKFFAPISLGTEFVIEGVLKEDHDPLDQQEVCETWDMKMKSVDGSQVYNTIQDLKITRPNHSPEESIFSIPNPQPFSKDGGWATSSHPFSIYRDEIDAHWPGHLPLRNVLNLFERCRSMDLGGPSVLKKLKEEDGILAVVASLTDFCLIDEGQDCHAGDEVTVDTIYVMKRKGMIFEVSQTLTKDGKRLAQGMTTMMMINDLTGRPTSKLPQYLLDRFEESSHEKELKKN